MHINFKKDTLNGWIGNIPYPPHVPNVKIQTSHQYNSLIL